MAQDTRVISRKLREATCKQCGVVFIKQRVGSPGVYCSRDCHTVAQRVYVHTEIRCKQCNEVIAPRGRHRPTFCRMECKAEWQRSRKPVDREWLHQKYIVEGLDCTDIAALVSRDSKSVWNWLKDLDIPTRPRGSSLKRQFKKGHKLNAGRKASVETRQKIREARLRDGHVPYLKNGVHHLKGKRGADTPNWKGGITPERQAFYATPEWRRAAYQVKRRDRNTCQRCGKVKQRGDGQPFDLHHIVSFECVALRADVSNLVYLCEPCHYWIHGTENTQREWIKDAGS